MKDIPGYEGLYAITEDGDVWAYPRKRSSKFGKWLIVSTHTNQRNRVTPRQHKCIGLYKNNQRKAFQVHRLVAMTYIPNPHNLPQVNHKDGNPLNNHVSNLEWVTQAENIQHGIKLGLIDLYSGKQAITRSRNGRRMGPLNSIKSRRLFTMEEAECIRKIHAVGNKSCRAIAKVYGCADHTILNICKYKSYMMEG
jgi:hypothetical protein